MLSLLVAVFAVELVVYVLNGVGVATVNNLLWSTANIFPTQRSKIAAEQKKLQGEYLRCRHELNGTSSQDEFAKWARLRRHFYKLQDELEMRKRALDASRASFDTDVATIRFILTRGVQFLLPFWFSAEPMFWLPYGWFPYYAEWILSFPRAPLGSVSIASWQVACSAAISLLCQAAGLVVAGLVPETGKKMEDPLSEAMEQEPLGAMEQEKTGSPASTAENSMKEL